MNVEPILILIKQKVIMMLKGEMVHLVKLKILEWGHPLMVRYIAGKLFIRHQGIRFNTCSYFQA